MFEYSGIFGGYTHLILALGYYYMSGFGFGLGSCYVYVWLAWESQMVHSFGFGSWLLLHVWVGIWARGPVMIMSG